MSEREKFIAWHKKQFNDFWQGNPTHEERWVTWQAATEATKATSVAPAGEFPEVVYLAKDPNPRYGLWHEVVNKSQGTPFVPAEIARQPAPALPERVRELECVIADLTRECNELRAASAATTAPVLGLKMICDPNMPSDQVEFRINDETVGRIVNIATRSQP